MKNAHTFRTAALAVLIAGLAITSPARASIEASRTQYLTFTRPVALPGVALHAGTYIFELPSPEASPAIVRVTSRDRKIVYFTAFTREVDRPAATPLSEVVTLKEAGPGLPAPITVWWVDARAGRQFLYVQ